MTCQRLIIMVLVVVGMATSAQAQQAAVDLDDNAALLYWPAFTLVPHDDADATLIGEFNRHHDPGKHVLPSGSSAAMRLLREGAAIADCRWGVRLDQDGVNTVMTEASQGRPLAFFAAYIAYQRARDGHLEEAQNDLLATIAMGRHYCNPRATLTDFIVGYSIEAIGLHGLGELYPLLDRDARLALAHRIEQLRPASSPCDCLDSERRLLAWMVAHADDPTDGVEVPDQPGSEVVVNPLRALHLPHDQMLVMAAQTAHDYDDLGRLWALPDVTFMAAANAFAKRPFNALSTDQLPNPELLWKVDYHSRHSVDLLIHILRSDDLVNDHSITALGAVVQPGPPITVSLPDPADFVPKRLKPPTIFYLGRHWSVTPPGHSTEVSPSPGTPGTRPP